MSVFVLLLFVCFFVCFGWCECGWVFFLLLFSSFFSFFLGGGGVEFCSLLLFLFVCFGGIVEHRATQDSFYVYIMTELYIIKAPGYRRQNNRHIDCGPLKLNGKRRITILLWELFFLSVCVYTPHVVFSKCMCIHTPCL